MDGKKTQRREEKPNFILFYLNLSFIQMKILGKCLLGMCECVLVIM